LISVALTGNAASGKSTVADLWRRAGVPVVGADDLARQVVEPGTPGLDALVAAFGRDVLADDGWLDRARLRARVLDDDEARRVLEAILHPRIQTARDRWMRARWAEGAPLVVSEIPLLFEIGAEGEFDAVVLVDAPEALRLRRLVERGLSEAEARSLMAAQMDASHKRARADFVIDNAGTREALAREAERVLRTLRDLPERAGPREGWMRLDLHMHTAASFDCLSDPDAVLARALERGMGRIAVTDHNELRAALELHGRHPDLVIPGEEVKTAEGIDVIGLYLREAIPKGTPAAEVCARVREQGGLVYLPHPFARGKGGSGRHAEALADRLDIVEVFNARLHPGHLNEPAETFAERHGLVRAAGSDAHTVGEVAGAWVEVPRHPNEPQALLEALRLARVRGRTTPWAVHLASTWAKVRKRLPGG